MLHVVDLSMRFGDQVLFEPASFSIADDDKIGLVGRNGHGKTTLLRILTGEIHASTGEVRIPTGYRAGYLSQHLNLKAATILEEASAELPVLEGGWRETHRAEEILQGLGFSRADLARSPLEFSGGFQVRLALARLLASEPQLLLLDEPTNYLDIVSIRWLQRFLRA